MIYLVATEFGSYSRRTEPGLLYTLELHVTWASSIVYNPLFNQPSVVKIHKDQNVPMTYGWTTTKKSGPISSITLPYKMGQDFLDIQFSTMRTNCAFIYLMLRKLQKKSYNYQTLEQDKTLEIGVKT